MLTVKVMKQAVHANGGGPAVPDEDTVGRFSTKIVEAKEVDIHVLRPGELMEVAGLRGDRESFAFYIADGRKPRPSGFADEVDFWFAAFVENSAGATTEAVRF